MSRANGSTLRLDNGTSSGTRNTEIDCRTEPGAAEAAHEHEVALVRDGLLGLDAPQRTILALYYFEGLTVDQIGVVLNVASSEVAHLRTNALESLQGSLARRAA